MKKRFSGPQIVAKLRQADILIGHGKKIPEVCKEIDVSENTYYPCANTPEDGDYLTVMRCNAVELKRVLAK